MNDIVNSHEQVCRCERVFVLVRMRVQSPMANGGIGGAGCQCEQRYRRIRERACRRCGQAGGDDAKGCESVDTISNSGSDESERVDVNKSIGA